MEETKLVKSEVYHASSDLDLLICVCCQITRHKVEKKLIIVLTLKSTIWWEKEGGDCEHRNSGDSRCRVCPRIYPEVTPIFNDLRDTAPLLRSQTFM